VAVASAGPYASLHLAADRQTRQHPTTQFFTGWMPFLPPNQERQSTEGTVLDKGPLNRWVCVCVPGTVFVLPVSIVASGDGADEVRMTGIQL